MTYQCRHCNTPNQPDAWFCLDCGEPLDATTLGAAPRERRPQGGRAWRGPHRYEALTGAVLVVSLLALVLYSTWRGERDHQEVIYQHALTDLTAHQWAAAIQELRIVGNYADAPRRLRETAALWTQLQALDTAARQREQAGDWWAAAAPLRQLAVLDARYPHITARLAVAQQQIGLLIYRVAAGPQAGVWWARADGSDPQRLPDGTAPGLTIYGLSPDGRWAVYAVPPLLGTPADAPRLHILDLHSGDLTTLPLPSAGHPDPQPVRFRNDGQGFWWVADDGWSYYDLLTRHLTPIRGQVLAADPQNGRLVQALFGPFNSALDWNSLLLLTDATGGHQEKLFGLGGSVSSGRISPDGRLLLYQAHTRQFDQVDDQLWAMWLPGPGDPEGVPHGAILDSLRATPGAPAPILTSTFLPPGADGAPQALLTWAGGPLRQVTPALAQNLDFNLGTLHLGAQVRFAGLLTSAASRLDAVRVRAPLGLTLDWLGATVALPAIFYRGPTADGQLGLFLAPIASAASGATPVPPAARRLLTRSADPAAWIHSTALSHDGTRLLAILPAGSPTGGATAGLWAIPLDGHLAQQVVPDAVEFWTPEGWLGSP